MHTAYIKLPSGQHKALYVVCIQHITPAYLFGFDSLSPVPFVHRYHQILNLALFVYEPRYHLELQGRSPYPIPYL